jgi:1,4-alpha-glucan branching enzyme
MSDNRNSNTMVITPEANISAADLERLYSLKTVTPDHITVDTPMGANLTRNGATFRVWAPRAREVYIKLNANGDQWKPDPGSLLVKDQNGYWAGYIDGAKDGDTYRFYVVGEGGEGYKRDPYARELTRSGYPNWECIIRDPNSFPWSRPDFRTSAFNDLIIYQIHVGTFYSVDSSGKDNRVERVATFLDVIEKVEYLLELGINAIQLMPVDDFPGTRSQGYNGVDLYSPEMTYTVPPENLAPYLTRINALLAKKNRPALSQDQLAPQINQLKALVDIFHLFEIEVLFDVVYNHADNGRMDNIKNPGYDDQSIYFFDRKNWKDNNNDGWGDNNNDSLYFTDQHHVGPVFAFGDDYQYKDGVRQFLIDNAQFLIDEYHIDGIRYDQVTVIDENGGWHFCQDLTDTMHSHKPSAINIAEYWSKHQSGQRWWALWSRRDNGAGFDAVWHDGARDSIHKVIQQASYGAGGELDLDQIRDKTLFRPHNYPAAWNSVQYIDNHDSLLITHGPNDKKPRIVAEADGLNHRSWHAMSRARVANGLLLTAPGIPMIFMGQEFAEDKYWSDNPSHQPERDTLIWWDGLNTQSNMKNFQRFTRELIGVRRNQPALRNEPVHVYHIHNDNRIIAYHRWVPNEGRDVVIVASLNESTYWNYWIGFPGPGRWKEIFNSDVYENWVNPQVAGNGGEIWANGGPMHNLPNSAGIVIPANSILVFARE